MEEAVETIQLSGFDPDGEPSIRRTAEGRLWLCIEFMPPSWAPDEEQRGDLGRWADFDRQMARAIGVPVVWEDREWFLIARPRKDTVEAIQRFLHDVRQRYHTGGSATPAASPSKRSPARKPTEGKATGKTKGGKTSKDKH